MCTFFFFKEPLTITFLRQMLMLDNKTKFRERKSASVKKNSVIESQLRLSPLVTTGNWISADKYRSVQTVATEAWYRRRSRTSHMAINTCSYQPCWLLSGALTSLKYHYLCACRLSLEHVCYLVSDSGLIQWLRIIVSKLSDSVIVIGLLSRFRSLIQVFIAMKFAVWEFVWPGHNMSIILL